MPDTAGHHLLDCAVSAGDDWDNNNGANYRLWLDVDPVDAHVHARTPGLDPMGFESLRTALASGGMTHALVSWQDNDFVDRVADGVPWLTRLVWVRPGGPSPDDVRKRLAGGAVGLKLHPSFDEYPADTPGLDPFLEVAAEAGVPVTVHTAPGPSDPDLIRRLAERFPTVPFVLYHTFLGLPEGRRRAARHAQQVPNLYLETSWCRADEVRRLIDEVGAERVLFGSDAAVDGPAHFVRQPPNVEMVETYNEGLLSLARTLPADTFRALVQDNTRRLFGLAPAVTHRPTTSGPCSPTRSRWPSGSSRTSARTTSTAPRRAPSGTSATCSATWSRPSGRPTRWGGAPGPRRRISCGSSGETAGRRRSPRPPGRRGRRGLSTPRPCPTSGHPGPWSPRPWRCRASCSSWSRTPTTWPSPSGGPNRSTSSWREAALRIAQRLVPAELRTGSEAFAAPVPASSTADVYGRLAAFLGRTPS